MPRAPRQADDHEDRDSRDRRDEPIGATSEESSGIRDEEAAGDARPRRALRRARRRCRRSDRHRARAGTAGWRRRRRIRRRSRTARRASARGPAGYASPHRSIRGRRCGPPSPGRPPAEVWPMSCMNRKATTSVTPSIPARRMYGTPRSVAWATTPPSTEPSASRPPTQSAPPKTVSSCPEETGRPEGVDQPRLGGSREEREAQSEAGRRQRPADERRVDLPRPDRGVDARSVAAPSRYENRRPRVSATTSPHARRAPDRWRRTHWPRTPRCSTARHRAGRGY